VESFQNFIKQYHVRRFDKGEIILVQGEVPTSAYVIKKGIVKSYNLTSQGEEKPISFDLVLDTFPVGWLFNKIRWCQYYYEAFTDCEVYAVPKNELQQFLQKDSIVLYDFLQHIIGEYLNYQMRINALEQSKAAAKVINTLHFLCLIFGRDLKNDMVRIELPLTQQELANFMGLTRETTGIELKKLQRRGIITYKRQNYVVKTDQLDGLLDEDYEQGLIRD